MPTLSSIIPPINLSSVSGTIAVSNGGTGATSLTGVVKGTGTSALTAGTVSLTTEVSETLPVANGGTGATSLTGVVKGTGTSALTAGTVSLTTEVSGTLLVANGGTGATTLTGVVKGTGTSALTAGTVSLTTEVSGTLPVANGGTGATTLTANNVLLGNGTSALQTVAPGASGNVLTSNGTTWTSGAPPAGAWTLLGVVTANGSANVSFTTQLTSLYDDYVVLGDNITAATNNAVLVFQVFTNGAWVTSFNYYKYGLTEIFSNSSTASVVRADTDQYATVASGVSSSYFTGFTLSMYGWLDAATTSKPYTTIASGMSGTNARLTTGGGCYFQAAGSPAAITGIRFQMSIGNISAGRFRIYGIKKS